MKNYEILGCEVLQRALFTKEKIDEEFFGLGNWPPDWSQASVRCSDARTCVEIATFQHLGFDVSHFDLNYFVDQGLKIAVDYFWGEYRNDSKYEGEDPSRRKWLEAYRYGLLLSLLVMDKAAEDKLTSRIDPTLPFDATPYLLDQADNDYHKLLAEYLKSGELVTTELVESIKTQKKQRPKLLLASLEAIIAQDAKSFTVSIKKYLDYYFKNKREFGDTGIASYFSIEGSILCHVAQRAGIEPTGLSDKQMALIMSRESLGLAP